MYKRQTAAPDTFASLHPFRIKAIPQPKIGHLYPPRRRIRKDVKGMNAAQEPAHNVSNVDRPSDSVFPKTEACCIVRKQHTAQDSLVDSGDALFASHSRFRLHMQTTLARLVLLRNLLRPVSSPPARAHVHTPKTAPRASQRVP